MGLQGVHGNLYKGHMASSKSHMASSKGSHGIL